MLISDLFLLYQKTLKLIIISKSYFFFEKSYQNTTLTQSKANLPTLREHTTIPEVDFLSCLHPLIFHMPCTTLFCRRGFHLQGQLEIVKQRIQVAVLNVPT